MVRQLCDHHTLIWTKMPMLRMFASCLPDCLKLRHCIQCIQPCTSGNHFDYADMSMIKSRASFTILINNSVRYHMYMYVRYHIWSGWIGYLRSAAKQITAIVLLFFKTTNYHENNKKKILPHAPAQFSYKVSMKTPEGPSGLPCSIPFWPSFSFENAAV